MPNLFNECDNLAQDLELLFYNLKSRSTAYLPLTVKAIVCGLYLALPGTPREKYDQIFKQTGVAERTVRDLLHKAISRGFDFRTDGCRILPEHICDAPRSGPPNTAVNENNIRQVIEIVTKDRNGREKSAEVIAAELDAPISRASVCRIMRKAGFKKVKKTTKPGLNTAQKASRLAFCRKYQDWTLADWKKVIWSDETFVVISARRGSYKIWRRSDEGLIEEVTRKRWKGYMEFMFWGCFSYDRKGPCHIWQPETEKEKTEAMEEINQSNFDSEPLLKELWELINPGKTWHFDAAHGKMERRAKKGGIDWYRYWKIILEKKLLPFAFRCKNLDGDTLVQEDRASSYRYHNQPRIFDFWGIKKIFWPGNFLDLNAIEPC